MIEKTLVIIRHAKSSWKDLSLDDYDRPLNKRGKRDAPFMGKMMRDRYPDLYPDLILSSSAKRAKKTAKKFFDEFFKDRSSQIIHFRKDIYHAGYHQIFDILTQIDEDQQTVFLFGHNPSLHIALEKITDQEFDNFPTSGIAIIRLPISQWNQINQARGKLLAYEFPKKYFPKESFKI